MRSLTSTHHAIRAWYDAHGRKELPWRNTNDPYAIYLSEIMLQQTQVRTVLERFYFPFLERFPTLQALAHAEEQEVLKQWEGLGYYTRARNLHKAAKKSENRLSSEVEALIALPGVGKNTAHAIAAFAFHQPVPVLEANVKRVLARVFALKAPTEKQLWKYAEKLLDRKDPFTYNQAMMDIGSMVCTKAKPACSTCPLTEICQGKESPECYPQSKAKRKTPVRERDIVIFRGHRHPNNTPYYYLTPRTTRFLNGLYGFPEFEKGAEPVLQQVSYAKGDAIGTVRQVYSHFTLQAELFLVNVVMKNDTCWYTLDAIRTLPLSKADQKIVQFLE